MMAFFLLLWLISMTTTEQKKGLADYFAPPNVSESPAAPAASSAAPRSTSSGAKQTPTPLETQEEILTPDRERGDRLAQPDHRPADSVSDGENDPLSAASSTDLKSTFDQSFHAAAASIRQAWQAMPNITDIADNLLVAGDREGPQHP